MTQKWETFDHKIMEMCDIFSMGIFFNILFVVVLVLLCWHRT